MIGAPPPPPPPPSAAKASRGRSADRRRLGLGLDDRDEEDRDFAGGVAGGHGAFCADLLLTHGRDGSFGSNGSVGRLAGTRLFESIREEEDEEDEGSSTGELSSPARKALFGMDEGGGEEEDRSPSPRALFSSSSKLDEEEAPQRLFAVVGPEGGEGLSSSGTLSTSEMSSFLTTGCRSLQSPLFRKGREDGVASPPPPPPPPSCAPQPRSPRPLRRTVRERSVHDDDGASSSEEESDEDTVVEEEPSSDDAEGGDDEDPDLALTGRNTRKRPVGLRSPARRCPFSPAEMNAASAAGRATWPAKANSTDSGWRKGGGTRRGDDCCDPASPTYRVLSKVRRLNLDSVDVSAAKRSARGVERWTDRRGSPIERAKAVRMDDCIEEEGEDEEEEHGSVCRSRDLCGSGGCGGGGDEEDDNKENSAKVNGATGGKRRDAFRALRAEGRLTFDRADAMEEEGGVDDANGVADPGTDDDSPKTVDGRKSLCLEGITDDISPTNVADFPCNSFSFGASSTNQQTRSQAPCNSGSPPGSFVSPRHRAWLRPPSQPRLLEDDGRDADGGDDDAPSTPPEAVRRSPEVPVAPSTPKTRRRRSAGGSDIPEQPPMDAPGRGGGGAAYWPSHDARVRVGAAGGGAIPPTPAVERRSLRRTPRALDARDDGDGEADGRERRPAPGRFASDFETLGSPLGSGSFGTVHRVRSRLDGQLYAVKVARRSARGRAERRRMLQEVYALAALCDTSESAAFHIVRYHQAWLEDDRLFIQTELCGSNLLQEITAGSGGGGDRPVMAVEARYRLLREMLLALDLIHRSGMVHLDIKPENIFVKSGKYKLGDFGLVSKVKQNGGDVEEGDSRYMSMELLSGDHDDLTKSDIFSLGATVYEICLGRPLPAHGLEWHEIRSGTLRPMPHTPEALRTTVAEMMAPDPADRPQAAELLRRRHLLSECERRLILEKNRAMHASRALAENVQRQKEEVRQRSAGGLGGAGGVGGEKDWKFGVLSRSGMLRRGKLTRHNTWNGP